SVASCSSYAAPGGEIGLHRVFHVQQIANLAAISVDGDRLAVDRSTNEMRNPALILRAELPRPVNAAHPHDDGWQTEAAGVIQHVLIGSTLRAAVRRMQGERL